MTSEQRNDATSSQSALYGPDYYRSHCGPVPYDRAEGCWSEFFGTIADELIKTLHPSRVFDAGCAHGFLVEALWDRGVEAWGRDISDFAISQVRADVRSFCSVGSLTEPIEGRFDIVVCIEVLEHMEPLEASKALDNMVAASDWIVFSSSPSDLDEPTHINVRPLAYWLREFRERGYRLAHRPELSSISPWTLVLRKEAEADVEANLSTEVELAHRRLSSAGQVHQIARLNGLVADYEGQLANQHRELERVQGDVEKLTGVIAQRDRQLADQHQAIERGRGDVDDLSSALAQRDTRLADQHQDLMSVRGQIEALSERLVQRDTRLADQHQGLIRANEQIDALSKTLAQHDKQLADHHKAIERDRGDVGDLSSAPPQRETLGVASALYTKFLPRTMARLIESRAMKTPLPHDTADFDRDWYWSAYPDVADAGVDPFDHYVKHGRREGRFPNKGALSTQLGFDERWYLGHYPDVAAAGVDPLDHYVEFGRSEGRFVNGKHADEVGVAQKDIGHGFVAAGVSPLRREDLCDTDCVRQEPKAYDPSFCISVLTPTFNTLPVYLDELYRSLANQRYGNWEWIVVDDGSRRSDTILALNELAKADKRIKLRLGSTNRGISGASNIALELASGIYVALVDHDDLLARDVLWKIYEEWTKNPQIDLIYTDECKLADDGTIYDIWLKSAFSQVYLENTMCVGHLSVYRTDFLRNIGGFDTKFDGTQDYELALRASRSTKSIRHLQTIGYLWRAIPGSTAMSVDEKSYAVDRQKKALLEHALTLHSAASVEHAFSLGYWRTKYPLPEKPPLLSYIVPAGGATRTIRGTNAELVVHCVESFISSEFYPNAEFIIIHNGSLPISQTKKLERLPRVKLITNESAEFNFSQTVNLGVRLARGEIICLLNDDIEAITPRGGEELIGFLLAHPSVGAIAPKCLFEDETIQQNGVMLIEAGPAHTATRCPRDFDGPLSMLRCRRETFCIGGAILFAKRDVYQSLGGFAEHYPLNYNDVDFCLRLRESGYSCVVDPYIEVYHFESATKTTYFPVEKQRLFVDHPKMHDPYFNTKFDQRRSDYQILLENDDRRLSLDTWIDRRIAKRHGLPTSDPKLNIAVVVEICDESAEVLEEVFKAILMQNYACSHLVFLDRGSRQEETATWLQRLPKRSHRGLRVELIEDAASVPNSIRHSDYTACFSAQGFPCADAMQVIAIAIEASPEAYAFFGDEVEIIAGSGELRPFFKCAFDFYVYASGRDPVSAVVVKTDRLLESLEKRRLKSIPDLDALLLNLYQDDDDGLCHIREIIYYRRRAEERSTGSRQYAISTELEEKNLETTLCRETRVFDFPAPDLLRLKTTVPVSNIAEIPASHLWSDPKNGIDRMVCAARQPGVEWVWLSLESSSDALLEVSAIARLSQKVSAVCGVVFDADRRIFASGGYFLKGGGVFDPFAGSLLHDGRYYGTLWCQRCIDVPVPGNVIIRVASLLRATARNGVCDADTLMTALGLDAHEHNNHVAVTPYLSAPLPSVRSFLPAMDRAGLIAESDASKTGSRWYPSHICLDSPFLPPGLSEDVACRAFKEAK